MLWISKADWNLGCKDFVSMLSQYTATFFPSGTSYSLIFRNVEMTSYIKTIDLISF